MFALPLVLILIYLFSFILPVLIVCLWKSRPLLAFLMASVVLFIAWVTPGVIRTYQAMQIYGARDPQLMAGGISETIVTTLLAMFIGLPLLALIQWVARRHYKRALKEKPPKDIFL